MNQELNKCVFCGEMKPVSRQYFRVKNKHFDDNKQGCYHEFVSYCSDCGIEISDGYHTFDELYEHRILLFLSLCKEIVNNPSYQVGQKSEVWCSTTHSDGSKFGDWFVMGIGKEKGEQITYHIPARFWEYATQFATVLEVAPDWDGHTPNDVIDRLMEM